MSSVLSFHKELYLSVNHETALFYKISEYKNFIRISIFSLLINVIDDYITASE